MNERDLFPGAAQAAQYGERQESVQSPPIIEQTPAEPESKPNETQLRWSPPETVAKHGGVEPTEPSTPPAPRADSVNMDDVVADLSGGWLPTRQERAATVPVRATRGIHGALARMGLPIGPGAAERAERERLVLIEDAERQIRQARWPRAAVGVLVANRKGGAGKALEVHEPVLTPDGYREIGTLTPGDLVMGRGGQAHVVLGVYPQGERELFRITLSDGTSILADGEHLWEVQTYSDRGRGECSVDGCEGRVLARARCSGHYKHQWLGQPTRALRQGAYGSVHRTAAGGRVMSTAQLLEAGLSVDRGARGKRHQHFLPVAAPVEFAGEQPLPLDPYLLGLLIGDGYLNSPLAFTTADAELATAASEALPTGAALRFKDRYDYRIVRERTSEANGLRAPLEALGLYGLTSGHKFVPAAYKLGSVDTRTALLQGLLDTDGWVERGVAAGFCTVSATLADDVQFIAETLGCVVTRGSAVSAYTHNGERRTGKLAYRLRITAPAGLTLFRLERKRAQMHVGQRVPYRAIVSIEPAGVGEAVCIAVSADDHLFLTRNCVPTHNTPTAVCLGGALAFIRGGGVAIQEVADDPGTIAGRAEGSPLRGIGELMQEVGAIRSKGELESYTQPQTSHAHVIGSPRRRPGLTGEDVRAIAQVIDEYYSIRLMDSGNQMTSSAFIEAVRLADALVIPNPNAGDSTTDMVALFNELRAMSEHGRRLASTATILRIHDGRPEDPAVVERIDNIIEQLRAEYPNVAVVDVPYDEHLAGRGEITLASLARPTYEAFALAGASVVRAIHQSDRH